MTKPQAPRIFISYATADGAAFASQLRRDLEAEGRSIWQDIAALEGGRDWWSQIEAALKSRALEHLVLVLTPAALSRPVILDEIHLAREQGKTIIPVIPVGGLPIDRLGKLPRHIGQVLDLARPEHHATFLDMLAGPSRQKPVPMMVKRPPAHYVPRKAEIDALKALLLDTSSREAVAITAALRGTTGYGKTTLARALAYDTDIRDAYFDGTLFVELGEKGRGRIVTVIADIVGLIDPERRRDFTTIDGARTALGEALGNRRFLFVIDDVWHRADLMPFLHGGPNTTRLITTRFAGELPSEVVQERIAAMTGGADGEAWQMLADGLPPDEVGANKGALVALAERRHNWPQALYLANGFLRTRMGITRRERRRGPRPGTGPGSGVGRGPAAGGGALARAIEAANAVLDARGGTALDPSRLKPAGDDEARYGQRHESVAEGMDLNLSLLDEANRARFAELAVFPEDVDVPIGIAARLWAETGGIDRHDTERLLEALDDASLLLGLDFDGGTFRFHDSVREYLHDRTGKAGLVEQHKRLVAAMGAIGDAGDAEAAETDYFYRHLPEHLHEAGDRAALDAKLLDPGWLQAKLAATKEPFALVADYEKFGQGPMQSLIGRTLRLTSGICARNPHQLVPQLLGRLMSVTDPAAPTFLAAARRHVIRPALLTQHPSMTSPGAESARLEGHRDEVAALAVLPDGRLASGGIDSTVRLWDPARGIETARLSPAGSVKVLAVLPDGRLASSGDDPTIRLWDPKRGVESARLVGHIDWVKALAVLPDGRFASSGDDGTIRLWDPKRGVETARMEGHDGPVQTLAVLPDGRLVSGGADGTIRLWDSARGRETARLEGHKGWVYSLAALPDGRLASGGDDGTLRLWDAASGAETARLEGHDRGVNALTMLPNGQLASGGWDRTVRVWDPASRVETERLEGHEAQVEALAVLPDGRLATGSADGTIRLWDLANRNGGGCAPKGPDRHVSALAALPDGRLATGSADGTIRLWDPANPAQPALLGGHDQDVNALAALRDGRLASAGLDHTVRVWDPKRCVETARLEGDGDSVYELAVLRDGRLAASGGAEGTIRIWDPTHGFQTSYLKYDSQYSSRMLAVLPDGRLASADSIDGPIRLWDPTRGAETATIETDGYPVMALAVLLDGRLAFNAYGTIRLWDPVHGVETARLEGHYRWVYALAALPDGRLASGGDDRTIRVWDPARGVEIARLEVDGAVTRLAALPDDRLVAGDQLGRLHWLEIVE